MHLVTRRFLICSHMLGITAVVKGNGGTESFIFLYSHTICQQARINYNYILPLICNFITSTSTYYYYHFHGENKKRGADHAPESQTTWNVWPPLCTATLEYNSRFGLLSAITGPKKATHYPCSSARTYTCVCVYTQARKKHRSQLKIQKATHEGIHARTQNEHTEAHARTNLKTHTWVSRHRCSPRITFSSSSGLELSREKFQQFHVDAYSR